jgi:hypothetical protein
MNIIRTLRSTKTKLIGGLIVGAITATVANADTPWWEKETGVLMHRYNKRMDECPTNGAMIDKGCCESVNKMTLDDLNNYVEAAQHAKMTPKERARNDEWVAFFRNLITGAHYAGH